MAKYSYAERAGDYAADLNLRSCRPRLNLETTRHGAFCACDDLWKWLLHETQEKIIANSGSLALGVLSVMFAGRVWAKYWHKHGEITCFTYRKIKDMATQQPWFCVPLIAVPVLKYNSVMSWRPPFVAYALIVGGWLLNTIGHVMMITTKDERFRKVFVPPSYLSLVLAAISATFASVVRRPACCC